jgi:hypothetical protein
LIGEGRRNHLAALSAATGRATAWNPKPDADVWALALRPGTVYAGGFFTAIGDLPQRSFAAFAGP